MLSWPLIIARSHQSLSYELFMKFMINAQGKCLGLFGTNGWVQPFIPNRPAEFNHLRGKTASAARILSPKQTGRPLPCLVLQPVLAVSCNSVLLPVLVVACNSVLLPVLVVSCSSVLILPVLVVSCSSVSAWWLSHLLDWTCSSPPPPHQPTAGCRRLSKHTHTHK